MNEYNLEYKKTGLNNNDYLFNNFIWIVRIIINFLQFVFTHISELFIVLCFTSHVY